jgi:hypothetical protein
MGYPPVGLNYDFKDIDGITIISFPLKNNREAGTGRVYPISGASSPDYSADIKP